MWKLLTHLKIAAKWSYYSKKSATDWKREGNTSRIGCKQSTVGLYCSRTRKGRTVLLCLSWYCGSDAAGWLLSMHLLRTELVVEVAAAAAGSARR